MAMSPGMMRAAYTLTLRLPGFRGKARLEALLRRRLRPPKTVLPNGIVMQLDPQEWCQIDLLAYGTREPETVALFERLLQPGDSCIDVGAHVGHLTLVAARAVGTAGTVVAVDPQPYTCERLLTNAALNGFSHLLVVVAAAGEADGLVTLHDQAVSDRSRLTLLGSGVNDSAQRFMVATVRLDSLADDLDPIRLLKIDVEGFEAAVLRGAGAVLARTGHVVLEVLPDEPARAEEVAELLRGHGFRLADVHGQPWAPGAALLENNLWAYKP